MFVLIMINKIKNIISVGGSALKRTWFNSAHGGLRGKKTSIDSNKVKIFLKINLLKHRNQIQLIALFSKFC